MKWFLFLGFFLAALSCQIPLSSPSSDSGGVKLRFLIAGADQTNSRSVGARLLLPTVSTLTATLKSSSTPGAAVLRRDATVAAGSSSVTLSFGLVPQGIYTVNAQAFDAVGVAQFQQTGTLNLIAGANSLTLNLVPVTAAATNQLVSAQTVAGTIVSGKTLSWAIPASSLVSGGWALTLTTSPAVLLYAQDSDGTLFPASNTNGSNTTVQVKNNASSFVTLYNPGTVDSAFALLLNGPATPSGTTVTGGITIVTPNGGVVNLTGPTSLTVGQTATFTASYAAAATYAWYLDGSTTSLGSAASVVLVPTQAQFGNHFLMVVVTNTATGLSYATSVGFTVGNAAALTVTTLAGTPGSFGYADATGAAASFNTPETMAVVGPRLYLADQGNALIRSVVIATGAVSTVAGIATAGANVDGAFGTNQFYSPTGLASDGTNLYVTDNVNHNIRKIVLSTGMVSTLAGPVSVISTSGYTDAAGTAARFNSPWGIATDGTNLYVADAGNNVIRKIVIATGAVSTLAGSSTAGFFDATGTSAMFSYPQGITTDGTNLYVADSGNNVIRKIVIATAVVSTLAGIGPASPGQADGPGTSATFNAPAGITTDGTFLYVADYNNAKVRKVSLANGAVSTFAGTGVIGSLDGPALSSTFASPAGIATDGTHFLVTDDNRHVIREIQ